LKREGVDVDPNVENCDYGKFGWIMDPEGTWIELWEPKLWWRLCQPRKKS